MPNHTASRLGATSGIAYVLSILILNSVESDSNLVLGAELLALLLFIPFLAYLWSLLRTVDAPGRWLSTTALCAGLTALTVKLMGVLPDIIARRGEVDGALETTLTRLGEVSFIASLPPLGLCMAAIAAIVVRTHALPTWLGWAAAAVAPLLVANGFDLGAEFGPAFLLFLVWTLLTSVVLLRRAVTAPPATIGGGEPIVEGASPQGALHASASTPR